MKKGQVHSTSSPFPYFSLLCCFRGGGNSSDGGVKSERVQDQKEKMLADLQLLWKEQCDHLRKKKEQFATEVCSTWIQGLLPQFVVQNSKWSQSPGSKVSHFRRGMVENTHRTHSAFSIGSNAVSFFFLFFILLHF